MKNEQPRLRFSGEAGNSYDDIECWFGKLAVIPPSDPYHDQLREQIIHLCLPLADHIARRYYGRGEDHEDLLQVARIGLLLAIDRFQVDRGTPFLSFAIPTIMGEVRRHFRDRAWAARVPRPIKELSNQLGPATETLAQKLQRTPNASELTAELNADRAELAQAQLAVNAYRCDSLESYWKPDDEDDGNHTGHDFGAEDPMYELTENAMSVRPLLHALPERERNILIWRFGYSLTQHEIAERVGVSQMQVSRLLSQTLRRLREQALAQPPAADICTGAAAA